MLTRLKQLASLARIKQPVAPGICKFYFLPVERIAGNFELMQEPGVAGYMPAISGKLNLGVFTNFSREYTEQFKESDKGDFYEITLNAFLPYENKINHVLLSQMSYHRYIMFVFTPAGLIKILGTKENPVKMIQSFSGGKSGSGTPVGSPISFYWKTDTKPLLLFRKQMLDPYLP